MGKRLICWFSCGAASAVATHTAIEINKKENRFDEVVVAYTEVKEEHPDNKRFLKDCEKWFGAPITVLRNEKYDGSIVIRLKSAAIWLESLEHLAHVY